MRLTRVSQDKSALDGAKNITLFSAAICGELTTGRQSGDGVGLMLPLSPGRRLGKMCAQSGAHLGPLCVAKHVDKVQISRDQRLERAVEHQRFNRASPVTQGPAGPRQVDTPLVHVQGLGAEVHLGQVHEALGVGRAEELAHLDGTRFAVLLALPAKPCPCEPPGSRRQGACGDPAKQSGQRCMNLVSMNPARNIEQVSDVLRTSPSRTWSSESRVVHTREGPVPRWTLAKQEGEPIEDHSGRLTQVRR